MLGVYECRCLILSSVLGVGLACREVGWFEREIELKSLILAQIERWRHALHMQVERQRALRGAGEWRTGE